MTSRLGYDHFVYAPQEKEKTTFGNPAWHLLIWVNDLSQKTQYVELAAFDHSEALFLSQS